MHCAVEYGSPCDADHVTFGELCVMVDELQHHNQVGVSPEHPKSHIKAKHSSSTNSRRARKESLANFQVHFHFFFFFYNQ